MKTRGLFALLVLMSAAIANPVSAQTLAEYARQCEAEVGPVPSFDCNAGTDVPITDHGQTPTIYTPQMTCDRPALLPYDADTFGQCTPYSKIQNLSKGTLQISAFCRREFLREPNSPRYDEVDVILHSAANGKTCWFHAQSKPGDHQGFDASKVPAPSAPGADQFWWSPKATASKGCGLCHDADPFMYSPWLGQRWQHVPGDPFGRYSHVGPDFSGWHTSAIDTPNNSCTGCHRIGDKASCAQYIDLAAGHPPAPPGSNDWAKAYPLSHWMPVNNNQSEAFWKLAHQGSVDALKACCQDPNGAACTVTPITPR